MITVAEEVQLQEADCVDGLLACSSMIDKSHLTAHAAVSSAAVAGGKEAGAGGAANPGIHAAAEAESLLQCHGRQRRCRCHASRDLFWRHARPGEADCRYFQCLSDLMHP